MNKTRDEAFALIESMASHHFKWSSERAVVPKSLGIHAISSVEAVVAQVEIMNRKMASILSERSSVSLASVQMTKPTCDVCGSPGHMNGECTYYAAVGPSVSEVNYAQGQGPFSQSYNPSWKHHPNLSYKQSPSSYVHHGGQSSVGSKTIYQSPTSHTQSPAMHFQKQVDA
jgi:hypothetical protein